ncbi:transposase [bacterium]|nr:transposase [bacterium]
MPNFRRAFISGGAYFFTVVTANRLPVFENESARTLLSQVMRECQTRYPYEVIALVLLPDHLHALWSLPPGDDQFAARWSMIKREFTRRWLALGGSEQQRSDAKARQRRRGVWQYRYWEHSIRDQKDLEAHFDYIHYNPVKHGYVNRPIDWPWSTFHRWVREGHYPTDWVDGSCSTIESVGE